MRLNRLFRILNEMTQREATSVFKRFGVNPMGLDPTGLKRARNRLVQKHHPDLGGKTTDAQLINAAYDVLSKNSSSSFEPYAGRPKNAAGAQQWDDYWDKQRQHRAKKRAENETSADDAWKWAGHAGGSPPSDSIYRQDYRDMNFFKKRMWELSGHSTEEWTIRAFDGTFFRSSLTVYGNTSIFHDMAEAMIQWNSHGGNPYATRAVLANKRNSKDLYVIYSDGQFFDKNPPMVNHDSFNLNPSNDEQFTRKLPEFLDRLKNKA